MIKFIMSNWLTFLLGSLIIGLAIWTIFEAENPAEICPYCGEIVIMKYHFCEKRIEMLKRQDTRRVR